MQEYNLALYQCYMRYLKYFGDVEVDEITDIGQFKKVFFSDGFDGETAGFTVTIICNDLQYQVFIKRLIIRLCVCGM